ncbi:DNA repair protein RecO [Gluconobacter morbifer G707]|uniref:DNA repair protein RecO n=1 Tax=Gluconobacter morbifer G707 TaxID=1088869 RepID=G6XIC6_9PROT|nr:DNA repair protein RecO [Gluconobacter morbifer G707]
MRDEQLDGTADDWIQGLALTGHFLSRWVFGIRHHPLPAARDRLVERVRRLTEPQGPVEEDLQ